MIDDNVFYDLFVSILEIKFLKKEDPMNESVIVEKLRTKSVCLKLIFKVCVLWLPRYFRYSIEAKTSQIYKDGRR